ncbi:MAG: AMIN domain-containing protein, partial [Gemmatimonadota bacterium]|nr:AMIN domain-containing protein [Gemmatimonadota bacterium]
MMLYRPVAALVSLLLLPPASANVRSVSVVPSTGRADVVIGIDAAVDVQDFTLDSPARVVVDLKGATLDMPGGSYDRVARGGVTNVRFSQFRSNIVRVVIELDGSHPYDVRRSANEVRVSISGGGSE